MPKRTTKHLGISTPYCQGGDIDVVSTDMLPHITCVPCLEKLDKEITEALAKVDRLLVALRSRAGRNHSAN